MWNIKLRDMNPELTIYSETVFYQATDSKPETVTKTKRTLSQRRTKNNKGNCRKYRFKRKTSQGFVGDGITSINQR